MIKNVVQYIKDIKHTMSFSTIDDVLFIYIPLIGLAISVPALLVVIGSIIVKALS